MAKIKPERRWQIRLLTQKIGETFEESSEHYKSIRQARERLQEYVNFRWQIKVGKGIVTVKRSENA